MATVYLDVDDEITSAASRMRTAAETRVLLVLPAGSRLGTSRINFRLLAREAATNGKDLSIVSPEASTRALAASAGLPVYASTFEYEEAVAAPAPPGAGGGSSGADDGGRDAGGRVGGPAIVAGGAALAAGGGAVGGAVGGAAGAPVAASGAAVGPGDAGGSPAGQEALADERTAAGDRRTTPAAASRAPAESAAMVGSGAGLPAAPVARSGRPRLRTPLALGLALLAVAVVVGGALAFLFLPSATVEVVVRPAPLGPMDMTITADPAVTAPDSATATVPAERPTFDLAASGTYPATGKKVTETKATGSVRWQNCDPTSAYQIPSGTIVRTRGGVAFAIDEAVFLPVALLSGNPPSITCQTRDVGVTAAAAGEAGNVSAGTITVVPAEYNSVVLRVSNPTPTAGGSRTETKQVSQKDVDAARKALTAKLDAQFAAILADPTQFTAPRVGFADTASRTAPAFDPDPAGFVGQEIDGFDLAATATGSVTVVDEASVSRMAEQALVASVPAGEQLVEGSTRVDLGEPTVQGQAVRYPAMATAEVITPVDPAEVRLAVAGKPVEEARQALAPYGDATLTVWPAWVTTVPTYDFRLDVKVTTEAPTGGGPGASPSGGPGEPSPGATVAPSASTSPSASGNP